MRQERTNPLKKKALKRASKIPVDSSKPVEREDGRRLRSDRNRAVIVLAMFKLIRGGDMSPGAAKVANAAGLSLRTVFRHFKEMDTLYREMTTLIEAEIRPIAEQPFTARGWRERLDEMISRRAQIYERIMPLKVAGSIRRFQSSFLRRDYDRFVQMEREGILQILPTRIQADTKMVAAIEMATAFQAWRRLRQDQELTPAQAEAVIRLLVEKLLGQD